MGFNLSLLEIEQEEKKADISYIISLFMIKTAIYLRFSHFNNDIYLM